MATQRKRSKAAIWIGAGAAVALSLASCAGGAEVDKSDDSGGASDGDVVLTFRSWSPIEQTTKQMKDVFEEEHPGVTVDSTIFNYPEYLVDLQTRASSDTFPDVVGLQPGAMTQQFRDHLLPLQDCAARVWGDDWEDLFYPIGLDQARAGNPEGDDNYYSLPLLVQTVNLWANTEIMEETGQDIPETWDEMVAFVDATKGGDFAPFMLPAKDDWVRNVVFLQIANNVAPGLVYEAEAGEAEWTDPDIVTAFEYWEKLFTENIAQDGALGLDAYPSAANQFEAGNAATIPLGAWWIQQSDPTKDQDSIPPLARGMEGFWPFLFPTIPGGASEAQFVGGIDVALGISKNSANPDEACDLVADWIAGSGGQKLINTMNDIPAVPNLEPEEFVSERQEEIWNLFVNDWLPNVKYSRYFDDPKMDQAVADALAQLATGAITPEQAGESIQVVQDEVLGR